jgi:GNAT superfamily N-acetyltransferase
MMAKPQQKHELPETLSFDQATNEQLDLVWRLNSQAWAASLSIEDYIKRERVLCEQSLNANGAWRTWILTKKDVPDEIIASCETFEKPILISTKEGASRARGYGIASVYTNPNYRGKGMASVLMNCLKTWIDGEGEGAVSVLYSDIGKVRFWNL